MTVGELCAALAREDQTALVILACDAEGNEFSELSAGIGTARWEVNSRCLSDDIQLDEILVGECDSLPAIVLWPVD